MDAADLTGRYEHLASVIRRGGQTWPAALDDAVVSELDRVVAVRDAEAVVDPELRSAGASHLAAVRSARPDSFDGDILALDRIESGVIAAVHARYFDMIATCDALADDLAMRERAEKLAAPDPLRTGSGRAAAIGLSAVVVADGYFTLGRRSEHVTLDPGLWHLVPSGTLDERGPTATLSAELLEERGVHDAGPARVIGLGYDLVRLRPEIAVITEDLGQLPPPSPGREFSEFRDVPLDLEAIAQAWALPLTPAAAVALAAVERALRG